MLVLKIEFNHLMEKIAESLDISEAHSKKAEDRYKSVGKWFEREESCISHMEPVIYPQGSFLLGTVIKPITDAEEYDIDLACQLNLSKDKITQQELKGLVGHEIRLYVQANNMNSPAEEGKRCWKIKYADEAKFHMDILPGIPGDHSFKNLIETKGVHRSLAETTIAITDNTLKNYKFLDLNWLHSNPKGFAAWFKERMQIQFTEKKLLAEAARADIAKIPDYQIKTTLQRAIQILKRHRDIRFVNDQDDKPISIAITTLAAHSYSNEENLTEALINIIEGMPRHIEFKNGSSWISNPVNPDENFADKWTKYPQREIKFREWLKQVKIDLYQALDNEDIHGFSESLEPFFGERIIKGVLEDFSKSSENSVSIPRKSLGLSRFDVSHRKPPLWPVQIKFLVTLSGLIKDNGQWLDFKSNSRPLPPESRLRFSASTDVPRPFDVFWQVVNTGEEAKNANDLRGEIFPTKTAGAGGLDQKEQTQYTGSHMIECFIIKRGACVARSGIFVVNIL